MADQRMDQLQTTLRDEKNAMRIIVEAARKLKHEKEALEGASEVATNRIAQLELQLRQAKEANTGNPQVGFDPLDAGFKVQELEERNRELEASLFVAESRVKDLEAKLRTSESDSTVRAEYEAKVINLEQKLERAALTEEALATEVSEARARLKEQAFGKSAMESSMEGTMVRMGSLRCQWETPAGETGSNENPSAQLEAVVLDDRTTFIAKFNAPSGARHIVATVGVHDLMEKAQKVMTLRNTSPPRSRQRHGTRARSPMGKSPPRSPRSGNKILMDAAALVAGGVNQ